MSYRDAAIAAAQRHNVPTDIFLRQIGAESSWNPDAVSGAGAIGLGQLMPGTAKDLGVDPRDPLQNLDGAARYMRQQYDQFGDWSKALAAYNAGAGNVRKYGGIPPFEETQNYVAKIMGDSSGTWGEGSWRPEQQQGMDPNALMALLQRQEPQQQRAPMVQSNAGSSGLNIPDFGATIRMGQRAYQQRMRGNG